MNNYANVKMSDITHEEFKKVCKLQGLKMTEVINEFARQHIRDYYSTKDVFQYVNWNDDVYICSPQNSDELVEYAFEGGIVINLTDLWYNFEKYFPTIYRKAQRDIFLTFKTLKEYEEYQELTNKLLIKMRGGKTLNRVFVFVMENSIILNPTLQFPDDAFDEDLPF